MTFMSSMWRRFYNLLNLIPDTLSTGHSYLNYFDHVIYFDHKAMASDDYGVIANELTKTICQDYEQKDEDLKKKVLEWEITLKKAGGRMDERRLVWSRMIYENQKC